jgi:hypothetical protein
LFNAAIALGLSVTVTGITAGVGNSTAVCANTGNAVLIANAKNNFFILCSFVSV